MTRRASGSRQAPTLVVERFLRAFATADAETIRELLAPDVVSHITNSAGRTDRIEGADPILAGVGAMDPVAAGLDMQLTQSPVIVESDRVLVTVEVRAARDGKSLHNYAGHLLRLAGGRIVEWHMVDAKPAESAAFWS
jgi:ketosteroid isomerase-like protein